MTVETKPLRRVAPGDQLAAAAEKLKDDAPKKPAKAEEQPAAEPAKPEKSGGNN